jgi:hypothetical protein
VEGNHFLDFWRIIDVARNCTDPTLRHGASNIFPNQAELGLAIVPLQLPWLRAMHMAMNAIIHRMELHVASAILLCELRVQ